MVHECPINHENNYGWEQSYLLKIIFYCSLQTIELTTSATEILLQMDARRFVYEPNNPYLCNRSQLGQVLYI